MRAIFDGITPAIDPTRELERFYERMRAGDIAGAQAIQQRFWRGEASLSPPDALRNPSLLAWGRDFAPAPDADFLFISGTPRSSTTALGRAMLVHPEVALFIELYGVQSGYVPQMLAPTNIRRLVDADLMKPLKRRSLELLEGGANGSMIGDKRPNFMTSAALTLANFRGRRVHVLHLVRDIREVAASYLRRRSEGSFPGDYDHAMAVAHANMNTRTALSLMDGLAPEHRLLVLDYATFWSDPANAARVMREIGLDPDRANPRALAKLFGNSEKLLGRDRALPDEALAYIEAHYDEVAATQLRERAFA